MEGNNRKLVRLARSTGLVLVFGAVFGVASATGAPPQIAVSPDPPTGWLTEGEFPITATVTSDREIQSFGWRVEGVGLRTWSSYCPRSQICEEMPSSITYTIRPASLPDGVRNLTFTAWQLGDLVGNRYPFEETSRTFQLRVDRTAPAAPEGLSLIGDAGWRSLNEFAIKWAKRTGDGGTAFVGATYRICPSANATDDATGCITGERRGAELESIAGIRVPGTGVWRLQLALEDAMGHLDLDAGAIIDQLRLDVEPPRLAFIPRDPADPARVQLGVSDEGSGIASVAIEARRQGDATWRMLSVSADEGRLTALLDDDNLPAGIYEVRGHASDAVGNERTVALNEAELIQLPVRRGSKLSAGVLNRNGRTKLDSRPSLRFGARVRVHGRVFDDLGKGRAKSHVEVSERLALPGVGWRRITKLTTDQNGAFTYTAPKGVARTLRFQYAGTAITRPAAAEVTLRVRASATLEPSRRILRNGDTVVLRGRILGQPIPSTGKLVTVQAWTSRGWLTFGNARAGAKHGRWSYRYTFTGTTTTSRYRFRVVIPREESYPYVTGSSPVRAVVVRGSG